MTVTVCVPAYRAGDFIAETVASVLAQSHADLRLVVAIDPPADGGPDTTERALGAFLADDRLTIRRNPVRLGWAENINSLLSDVATHYFAILPHDDLWVPTYLEVMLAALRDRPEAIGAYGDMLSFGATAPVRKSMVLGQGEDRAADLLRFLIQGTEAPMWRSVTRTAALDRVGGFPTDAHMGLVVECEYALALQVAGPLQHVPRTFYLKRIHEKDVISASRERLRQPEAERRMGWEEHDRRMAALLEAALTEMGAGSLERRLCHAAKEAALLGRCQQFVNPRLEEAGLARISAAVADCSTLSHPLAPEVRANLHMVLSRHWRALGEAGCATQASRSAWEVGSTFESVLAHAEALFLAGRSLDAIERATEALRIGHMSDTRRARALLDQICKGLGWLT
jgi:GT2 family glycosyltransferase